MLLGNALALPTLRRVLLLSWKREKRSSPAPSTIQKLLRIQRRNYAVFLFIGLCFGWSMAQEMPVTYSFGERYDDRYKCSALLDICDDGMGGAILVRSYYTGIV